MPILLRSKPSPTKSWEPQVTPSASGVSIEAFDLQLGDTLYQVPALTVACTYDGESTHYEISLCELNGQYALVLVEKSFEGASERLPAAANVVLSNLIWWDFTSPSDTCETVDIHVVHRTGPDDGTLLPSVTATHVVQGTVVNPPDNSEQAENRRVRARKREVRQQLQALKESNTPISAMTASELRIVVEGLALLADLPIVIE